MRVQFHNLQIMFLYQGHRVNVKVEEASMFVCPIRVQTFESSFLANVNSSSCSLYVIDGPSVCLSVVCL